MYKFWGKIKDYKKIAKIGLICACISNLNNLIGFNFINDNIEYGFVFNLENILYYLLTTISFVILFMGVVDLVSRKNKKILAFACACFFVFPQCRHNIWTFGGIVVLILSLAIAVLLILNVVREKKNEKLVSIALIIGILILTLALFISIARHIRKLYLFVLFDVLGIVATICGSLCIAILILGSDNNICENDFIKKELDILKSKLELGIITEEEYKKKREDIINKV